MQVDLVENFARHLNEEGLVSYTSNAATRNMTIATKSGLPEPTAARPMLFELRADGERGTRPLHGGFSYKSVRLWARCLNYIDGREAIENILRSVDDKREWTMHDAPISLSLVRQGPDEMRFTPDKFAGYLFTARVEFLVRRSLVR